MPLQLEPINVRNDLGDAESVLIVWCPVCPPISLAMQKNAPLIDFFKSGLKTVAFQEYVVELRDALEQDGVRTGTFSTYRPLPTMCLWTQGQRQRLLKRAEGYDVVLVLGCSSAAYTVMHALESTSCRVIPAMRMVGITNATVKYEPPLKLVLRETARVSSSGPVSVSESGETADI